MKFADPAMITCESCGVAGAYAVEALLAYAAVCAACGEPLSRANRDINESSYFAGRMAVLIELAFEVMDVVPIEYEDADLNPLLDNEAPTIGDFLARTAAILPADYDPQEMARHVLAIIADLSGHPVETLRPEQNLYTALALPLPRHRNS